METTYAPGWGNLPIEIITLSEADKDLIFIMQATGWN